MAWRRNLRDVLNVEGEKKRNQIMERPINSRLVQENGKGWGCVKTLYFSTIV